MPLENWKVMEVREDLVDFSFKANLEGSRGSRTMSARCFEGVGEATSALSEATVSSSEEQILL